MWKMKNVSLIGLGPMGSVLGDLLLKAAHPVTVWNRTPQKATRLVEHGAALAASAAEAISAGTITIVCLLDYSAVQDVLASSDASAALQDRLIVNLGTGGPEEARRLEAFVHERGGRYLDGAIQAAPSQMGKDDTPVFVSGMRSHFDEAHAVLRVFAGNVVHLGEAIDAAAYMDLATLSFVYGSYAGFLHGANIAGATGIDVATYGRLVNAISPSFGEFFHHEANVIASADFRITESPLRISIPAVRRILRASEDLSINVQVPALMDGWLQRAEAEGLANEELAALIKVIRGSASVSQTAAALDGCTA